jgi:hypothetical protein
LGFHSESYYDGFACDWCGAVGEAENHDLDEPDEDEWVNEGGPPSRNGNG